MSTNAAFEKAAIDLRKLNKKPPADDLLKAYGMFFIVDSQRRAEST